MRQAGAEILRIKTGGVEADYKADASPVTQADHASEAILKAALAQFFPDIPVISEENTESHLLSPAARKCLLKLRQQASAIQMNLPCPVQTPKDCFRRF